MAGEFKKVGVIGCNVICLDDEAATHVRGLATGVRLPGLSRQYSTVNLESASDNRPLFPATFALSLSLNLLSNALIRERGGGAHGGGSILADTFCDLVGGACVCVCVCVCVCTPCWMP
jgi:hypothetical protein